MKSGIYVWKLGGVPKYVGQGKNVEKRMIATHTECKVLFYAVNKYGFDSFEKEIICYCEPDEMGELEIYYIKELGTHVSEGGYNVSKGGDTPMLGRKMSDEAKQKISETNKGNTYWLGKTHSEQTKEKMSNVQKGRTFSDETKLKMSEAGKAKTFSEEHKLKISESKKGTSHSDKAKQKMSDAKKEYWANKKGGK